MDRIELTYKYKDRFTLDEIRHTFIGQEYRDIRCRILINGELIHDKFEVDLKQLVASMHDRGEYLIFTWQLEWPDFDPGCIPDDSPSYPVLVVHEDLKIIWKVPDPINVCEWEFEDTDDKIHYIQYVFDKKQYIEAIRTCLNSIKELLKDYRSFCHFGIIDFDEWDLLKLNI